MQIQAVIFDLDGVLTDTAELHFRAWQRLADAHGLDFDRELNEKLRGLSRADSLTRIVGHVKPDDATFEAMLDEKNRYYLEAMEGLGPGDLLPGARELVDDARARGWRTAIGSSSRNARQVLERLGIAECFDAVADGDVAERAKPAPDIFLAVARLLEVEPAGCVVVEDAASGVDAARAARMLVIGVGPVERVGHAHHHFETTAEVDFDVLEAGRG